ncbi:MAG: neprosin family prolyl endopeptidase [Acidobacteriaceae bacterium]
MAGKNISSLEEFRKSLDTAKHGNFAQAAQAKANESEFTAMKAHIVGLYRGVTEVHSFEDENGSIFDCIPVSQQPSLKGNAAAKAPALPSLDKKAGAQGEPVGDRKPVEIQPDFRSGKTDKHGNQMACSPGHIPMRRLTLEEMTRFASLNNFFQKSPEGGARPPRTIGNPTPVLEPTTSPAVAATHRWAHAYQNVNNLGGHSYLNVWDPAIGANQIFSLSQHWYVGGSGSGLQTAECGWQVYPGKYNTNLPVFFIYWTADDYNQTGCYNLECTAFVQTSHAATIGGTLSPSSTYGGAQYEIQLAYYLYQGNWWLYWGGGAASNAIGYYPTSLYRGGAMAHNAAEIDYGGEVVGTTSFPPMGSGHFASEGWTKACYQRDITYFPTNGGQVNAGLTPSQAWPKCYTSTVTLYASPWFETEFFGGPGGNC